MRLLYINVCSTSIYGYYVILLCNLNLEMIDHVHKYFGDFYNFISLVIRDENPKSKTCEGFFESLYVVWQSLADSGRVAEIQILGLSGFLDVPISCSSNPFERVQPILLTIEPGTGPQVRFSWRLEPRP